MRVVIGILIAFIGPGTGQAVAGPNEGGMIVLHYRAGLDCSAGGMSGLGELSVCGDAVVEAPPGSTPLVFFVYAAFPPGSSPRLGVLTFGLDYSETDVVLTAYGKTADSELSTTNPPWPQPGSGAAVAWDTAQTELVKEFYWFCGYGSQGQLLRLGPHPTQGGGFTDDAIPARTDPIADYGHLGFGVPGHRACPEAAQLGACCLRDGSCVTTVQSGCPPSGTWMGPDSACDPSPCPLVPSGACCTPEGRCSVSIRADCWDATYWLGEGTVCEPNPCPQLPIGACCNVLGFCRMLYEFQCEGVGVWQGAGTACDPNPCPPPPPGACCHANGTCRVTTQLGCGYYDEVWQGDGTVCDPNPCPQPPPGACCRANGTCRVTIRLYCGYYEVWQGDGTTCDPNPCPPPPPGACCHLDETKSRTCTITDAFHCDKGWWLGADASCEPNPCVPLPPGACCDNNGTCTMTAREQCRMAWLGPATNCVPNPCPPPVPVQRTTWGRLKRLYR